MSRRRSYRQRKEVLRRKTPVMIECVGDWAMHDRKPRPLVVTLGNEQYEFRTDGAGRLVTSVAIEPHIGCFLARADMYRAIG